MTPIHRSSVERRDLEGQLQCDKWPCTSRSGPGRQALLFCAVSEQRVGGVRGDRSARGAGPTELQPRGMFAGLSSIDSVLLQAGYECVQRVF